MVKVISSVALPADEVLMIQKNRIAPAELKRGAARLSIVSGIHGDELEGQYICFELTRILQENIEHLHGIVDIYPAMNPFGIDSVMRGIPGFDLDMNRIFPGNEEGDMMEHVAAEIVRDLEGSDVCIDIHASNMFLTEMPQIRINELDYKELVPLAKQMNVDLIWVHSNSTVLESTLAHSLNARGVKTLVVETGIGMRITKDYCHQLVDGILHLMKEMGMYSGETKAVRQPMYSDGMDDVEFLNAPCSGIFVKDLNHGTHVSPGDQVGRMVNPLTGEVLACVKAENEGVLFTVREYPFAQVGSLLGRILKDNREVRLQ